MEEKSNEITAIPKVLESIEIKDHVVTIDTMGTQTAIVETIQKRRADYVLAVKGNQGNLEADIREYFEDLQTCAEIKKGCGYKKTIERAHGQTEIREYYQDIAWMYQKKQWKGLKSIGIEKKTIRKGETEKEEYRYYISSLIEDIVLFSRAVRGHWAVESMHWHLDVTFKEDANTTLDKNSGPEPEYHPKVVPEHVKTDRNKRNGDVTKREAVQYKYCTGTVYRRTDENLKKLI